jgi:hypothetical protein
MGGLDSIPQDPKTAALIGGLMKLAGGADARAAPGAATQIGFKTDSTLQGPWDNATLLHGTQLLAVKADVMVGMDLKSADYEKAKALGCDLFEAVSANTLTVPIALPPADATVLILHDLCTLLEREISSVRSQLATQLRANKSSVREERDPEVPINALRSP